MEKRVHAGIVSGVAHAFDAVVLTGTTLTTPLIAQARESRDLAISLRGDLERKLQPAIVAIACAAMAVEAEVNWVAIRDDRAWFDAHLWEPTPTRWRAWLLHRRNVAIAPGGGLGQRVASLFDDRDMVVHFRGVPGTSSGGREIHQPPATGSGITAVRAYFTPERAAMHVATAEEAIATLE
jgi:hypothetical protein